MSYVYQHTKGSGLYQIGCNGNLVLYNKENGEIALLRGCGVENNITEQREVMSELHEMGFFACQRSIEEAKPLLHQENRFEQLYLITSEGCNLRCKYCRQHTSQHYRNLTNEEIYQAVSEFHKFSDTLKSVVFYGGEPLLNKEGVNYALQLIHNMNPDVHFSIITNATLCDEDMAQTLARYHVDVIVSVDGCKPYHDLARAYESGAPSYQDTIAGYWRLKSAGCVVGISCTIGPHNENHFDELVNWLIELHPDTAWFGLPHGAEDNYVMGQDTSMTYDRILGTYSVLKSHGISLLQVEKKIRDLLENSIIAYDCKACKNRLVACPGNEYGVCDGSVTDPKMFFKTVEEAKKTSKLFRETTPLTMDSCGECISQRICGGGCPYDKIMRYGKSTISDPYWCSFVRKLVVFSLQYVGSQLYAKEGNVIVADEEERMRILNQLNLSKPNSVPLLFNVENKL